VIVQAVTDQVRRFIIDELKWEGPAEELTGDLPLIRRGVLDSLGILTLVHFLESRYGIVVDDADIVPDHLGSLDRIERYVHDKKG
jgi:acyl carrier protein